MKRLTLLLKLAAPLALVMLAPLLALAQAPSGTGNLPPAPVQAPKPGTTVPVPTGLVLPAAAEVRLRLEALLGKFLDTPQLAAVASGWKTALGEARIAQNAYADRLAAITGLYRGRVLELLPPVEQIGAFDSMPLLLKLEKERGLPLTKEEKAAILDADKARRTQGQQLMTRMIETYAAAIAQPTDKVAKALNLAPAASARPSAALPAKN